MSDEVHEGFSVGGCPGGDVPDENDLVRATAEKRSVLYECLRAKTIERAGNTKKETIYVELSEIIDYLEDRMAWRDDSEGASSHLVNVGMAEDHFVLRDRVVLVALPKANGSVART